MLRRTRWSSPPLADGEVTALSSVRASVWPREAAPHTGQKPQDEASDAMDVAKGRVSFSAGEGHVAKNKGVNFERPMSAYAVSLTTPPEGGARGSHLPTHVGRGA